MDEAKHLKKIEEKLQTSITNSLLGWLFNSKGLNLFSNLKKFGSFVILTLFGFRFSYLK